MPFLCFGDVDKGRARSSIRVNRRIRQLSDLGRTESGAAYCGSVILSRRASSHRHEPAKHREEKAKR